MKTPCVSLTLSPHPLKWRDHNTEVGFLGFQDHDEQRKGSKPNPLLDEGTPKDGTSPCPSPVLREQSDRRPTTGSSPSHTLETSVSKNPFHELEKMESTSFLIRGRQWLLLLLWFEYPNDSNNFLYNYIYTNRITKLLVIDNDDDDDDNDDDDDDVNRPTMIPYLTGQESVYQRTRSTSRSDVSHQYRPRSYGTQDLDLDKRG